MNKLERQRQSEEMRQLHYQNRLDNLRIFHGWLGSQFFYHGQIRLPRQEIRKQRQEIRGIRR